jgi:hypothetical protein
VLSSLSSIPHFLLTFFPNCRLERYYCFCSVQGLQSCAMTWSYHLHSSNPCVSSYITSSLGNLNNIAK